MKKENHHMHTTISDSKRLIPEEYANLRNLHYLDFQKKWTRPQLRKAIKPFLPL